MSLFGRCFRCGRSSPPPLSLILHSPSSGGARKIVGLGCPRLRASNEHILIVRVPRAGGRPGCPSCPSEAARCASTEDHQPPSPFFYGRGPDARASVVVSMEACRIATMLVSSGSDVLSGGRRMRTLPIGRSRSPRLRASIVTLWPILASSW